MCGNHVIAGNPQTYPITDANISNTAKERSEDYGKFERKIPENQICKSDDAGLF